MMVWPEIAACDKFKWSTKKKTRNVLTLNVKIWWDLYRSDEICTDLMRSARIWWDLHRSDEICTDLMRSAKILLTRNMWRSRKISRDLSNMHCKSCSPYVQLLKKEMFMCQKFKCWRWRWRCLYVRSQRDTELDFFWLIQRNGIKTFEKD